MVRLTAIPLVILAAALAITAPADAGVSCHTINATGVGQGIGGVGTAADPVRTVARIRGGGLLQGTTDASFELTGATSDVVEFEGLLIFTVNRGTLTVAVTGRLDLESGAFTAAGPVEAATGKLTGAEGALTITGVQDLEDGSFTETLRGRICVDLGGNGSRS
jgi:hypothetical protein